jgi:hypothetical protein
MSRPAGGTAVTSFGLLGKVARSYSTAMSTLHANRACEARAPGPDWVKRGHVRPSRRVMCGEAAIRNTEWASMHDWRRPTPSELHGRCKLIHAPILKPCNESARPSLMNEQGNAQNCAARAGPSFTRYVFSLLEPPCKNHSGQRHTKCPYQVRD